MALIIIFLGLSGCIASLYLPTEEDAKIYNIPLTTLKEGRELYINKCSSCHNLYLPSNYTKHEWSLNLNKMQKRAKIDSTQKENITKYLEINAKR
ncbi:MAG: hypothetical protein ACOYO1_05945 [Bacteroidales bacterium]